MTINKTETLSKKKKRMKKMRICGKRLTKNEQEENAEIHKRSMADINKEFGR